MMTAAPTAPPLGAPTVDSAAFRRVLSRLAAGVSVVTTIGPDGQKLGLTATAVTAVSADPPLVLVCLGSWARAVEPMSAHAPFIIHLLAAEQQPLAEHFATPQADKFAALPHDTGHAGCPRLKDALAWIECVPHQLILAGDHTIVIGRVVALAGNDERAPLVYFRRRFYALREGAGSR